MKNFYIFVRQFASCLRDVRFVILVVFALILSGAGAILAVEKVSLLNTVYFALVRG